MSAHTKWEKWKRVAILPGLGGSLGRGRPPVPQDSFLPSRGTQSPQYSDGVTSSTGIKEAGTAFLRAGRQLAAYSF